VLEGTPSRTPFAAEVIRGQYFADADACIGVTHSRPLESAMRFWALDLNAWPDHFTLEICGVDRPRQP
jgi:hypothetical protein